MHQAAILGHSMEDARKYGWDYDSKGNVVVSASDFRSAVEGSEGRWFEAKLVSSLLCCFLRQETLLHLVSLHPGV